MPFAATGMDFEMITVSEVSQGWKDKYHMISLICGIKKKDTSELIYKTETDPQTKKQTYDHQRVKNAGGMVN